MTPLLIGFGFLDISGKHFDLLEEVIDLLLRILRALVLARPTA
jgi:hypothetical protein